MMGLDLIWTDAIVFEVVATVYWVSAALAALGLIIKELALRERRTMWTRVADILVGATVIGILNEAFFIVLLWLMTGGN